MSLNFIKALTLSGGDWVIWGLLACSVVAVAVVIERAIVLRREALGLDGLSARLRKQIDIGSFDALVKVVKAAPGAAGRILGAGLEPGLSAASAEDRFVAAGLEERRLLESRLLILGTLGNNAPFVGLFGTVLGVIRAFHDLAEHSAAGPEVVMSGLSEALVATAVGLLVAIPCVVSYNYFQKKVKDLLSATETLSRLILSRLRAGSAAG